MATLFVRHHVADFDKWKQAYDDFDSERRSLGVTGDGVYRTDQNPTEVTVYHEFETIEAARSFMESTRLREVMADAGVEGEPTVWFAHKV